MPDRPHRHYPLTLGPPARTSLLRHTHHHIHHPHRNIDLAEIPVHHLRLSLLLFSCLKKIFGLTFSVLAESREKAY